MCVYVCACVYVCVSIRSYNSFRFLVLDSVPCTSYKDKGNVYISTFQNIDQSNLCLRIVVINNTVINTPHANFKYTTICKTFAVR